MDVIFRLNIWERNTYGILHNRLLAEHKKNCEYYSSPVLLISKEYETNANETSKRQPTTRIQKVWAKYKRRKKKKLLKIGRLEGKKRDLASIDAMWPWHISVRWFSHSRKFFIIKWLARICRPIDIWMCLFVRNVWNIRKLYSNDRWVHRYCRCWCCCCCRRCYYCYCFCCCCCSADCFDHECAFYFAYQ